uniref:UDP-N-acetylglucosamine 1-carboxyvinyltransferase n=1 Tax=Prochloron didemni P3-Solomon TaxID=910458 RepID=G0XS72_PRODI|nr:UDP-N-acetylglucosamine 1-carboxyvinyltransferase NikO-like protein [Prochloron didemni P3-Solomon]
MDRLLIKGGYYRGGTVDISGFKHTLVLIMCASVMTDGALTINNVPDIEDTRVLIEILSFLGAKVSFVKKTLETDTTNLSLCPIPEILSKRIHGAIYLIPSLLSRFGRIEIGAIGGCPIGDVEKKVFVQSAKLLVLSKVLVLDLKILLAWSSELVKVLKELS